jgi:hypothetical protein
MRQKHRKERKMDWNELRDFIDTLSDDQRTHIVAVLDRNGCEFSGVTTTGINPKKITDENGFKALEPNEPYLVV